MIKILLLTITVIFFAINMGASGIAPSFAAAYGGKLIEKKRAIALFSVFVVIGACVLGSNVAKTLGSGLLPGRLINPDVVLIILASATISLFIANLAGVPQSTSQVTVFSIAGVGLFLGGLNINTIFFRIIPTWVILPLLAYAATFILYKKIYPPEHDNLHIYERVFANAKKIRATTIFVSCYVAFAIGSNNVANAAGPLYGAGILDAWLGLAMISPLFGLGAVLLGKKTIDTAGHEIVPLGLVSSTIVSFITATLLIIASCLGIPQSLVQLNIFSIFAISCLKNGHKDTIDYHVTKKTFKIWIITPLISLFISYLLTALFVPR